MTKAELIEEVSRAVEMTRKDSEQIVDTIFDSIVHALRSGDKIEVRGFGSFRVRQRNARVIIICNCHRSRDLSSPGSQHEILFGNPDDSRPYSHVGKLRPGPSSAGNRELRLAEP